MSAFDPKWPHGHEIVRDRDGHVWKARILACDLKGIEPIAAVQDPDRPDANIYRFNQWGVCAHWCLTLRNAPAPKASGTDYAVIFKPKNDEGPFLRRAFNSEAKRAREIAQYSSTHTAVAIYEHDWTEGDGL